MWSSSAPATPVLAPHSRSLAPVGMSRYSTANAGGGCLHAQRWHCRRQPAPQLSADGAPLWRSARRSNILRGARHLGPRLSRAAARSPVQRHALVPARRLCLDVAARALGLLLPPGADPSTVPVAPLALEHRRPRWGPPSPFGPLHGLPCGGPSSSHPHSAGRPRGLHAQDLCSEGRQIGATGGK